MPRNSLFRYFPGVPDLSVVEDFTISLFSQEMQPKFFFFLTQSHFSNLNSLLLHIILASSAVWISVDHKFTMLPWPPTVKNKVFFLCFLPPPPPPNQESQWSLSYPRLTPLQQLSQFTSHLHAWSSQSPRGYTTSWLTRWMLEPRVEWAPSAATAAL